MVKDDGACRYFSVRESATIQTFPGAYVFHGAWSETMRQLGNAVPVALAAQIMSSVGLQLVEAEFRKMGIDSANDLVARMNASAAIRTVRA